MNLKQFADAVFSASAPTDPRGFNIKHPQLFQQLKVQTSFLPQKATMTQRLWHIHKNEFSIPTCNRCSNSATWNKKTKCYNDFCSNSCRNKSKEFQQKCRQGMLKKYGVDNAMKISVFKQKQHFAVSQKSSRQKEKIQQHRRQTMKERYGVENILQKYRNAYDFSKEELTNLYCTERKTAKEIARIYGVNHSTIIKYLKKYNIGKLFNRGAISLDTLQILNNKEELKKLHLDEGKTLTEISLELGVDVTTISQRFKYFNIPVNNLPTISLGEKELVDFIRDLLPNEQIITNTKRVIPPRELDIFLPNLNIAIEYCGLYWHSSLFKDRFYHKDKWTECKRKGIRLITIFEDEWVFNKELVKKKLINILGLDHKKIYARQTRADIISDNHIIQRFYNENHIQQSPNVRMFSLTVSLTHKNVPVAMMSFIKRKNEYEIVRYATSHRVVGGFSKLLKYAINKLPENVTTLISFADLRWSDGNLYQQTGWKLDKILLPDYAYVYKGRREHKFNFRHKHLPQKLAKYNCNLSEKQNTENNGIYRIYNCGLLKYRLTLQKH